MHEQTSLDSIRTKQVRQIPNQLQPKHCIRIPCIRKWGAGFFCRIYVLWNIYIYICKWKIRNWGTLEFLRLNKLDVCEGAPLRPCSIFLTMKWFIKTRFYSEREMEPASLGTKHPPKWTLHNHGMVGNDKQKAGPTQGRATRRSRSMKVKTSARYWSDVVSYPRHPEVTPSQWHTGLPQAIRKLPQGPNPISTLVPHHHWFGKQNM